MRVTKNPVERKQELVLAAFQLFSEQGYSQTSVSDIVRKTGVAQGTFYYYFPSKDDILIAVVHHVIADFEKRLAEVVNHPSLTLTEKLEQLICLLPEMLQQRGDLIAFIHKDANAMLHHQLQGTAAHVLRRYLLILIEEGVAAGIFTLDYPEEAADFFLGGMFSLLHVPQFEDDAAYVTHFLVMAKILITRGLGITAR